jgi:hypothetical protein
MFLMQDATPEIVTLRMSRIGVLKRIIVFALQVLSGLASGKPNIKRLKRRTAFCIGSPWRPS